MTGALRPPAGDHMKPFKRAGGIALLGQGCAAFSGTLNGSPSPAAALSSGEPVAYTLDGVAYRTFTVPIEHLRRATLITLRRLEIGIQADEAKEDGAREMLA